MAITPKDFWRLHDELTVEEVARLIVEEDYDPTSSEYSGYVDIVRNALTRAVERKEIQFRVNEVPGVNFNGKQTKMNGDTYLSVSSMKSWFQQRGFKPIFFFPDTAETPDYLNPDHPRYAGKLAAAVNAWVNVTEVPGTSPKQSLVRWLRENASQYGLTDTEGFPVAKSIEDIATVANWNPKGGAPKTPGGTSED